MSGRVSAETAELCLVALNVCAKRAQTRLNGRELPAHWVTAIRELEAVVRAGDGAPDTAGFPGETEAGRRVPFVRPFEVIDVAEAARRLQISPQAVRKRLAVGSLPGRKVGRQWVVEWREKQGLGAVHRVDDGRASVSAPGAG